MGTKHLLLENLKRYPRCIIIKKKKRYASHAAAVQDKAAQTR